MLTDIMSAYMGTNTQIGLENVLIRAYLAMDDDMSLILYDSPVASEILMKHVFCVATSKAKRSLYREAIRNVNPFLSD